MPERSESTASSADVEKSITPEERAEEALRLKRQGFSFGYIAKQLKYKSRSSVVTAVQRALRAEGRMVDKDLVRLLDNERIEEMYKFINPRLKKGEPRAIEVGIRLLERRAKMWGYDEVDRPATKALIAPVVIQYLAHDEAAQIPEVAENEEVINEEDIIELPMLPSHESTLTKDELIEERIREFGTRDNEAGEADSPVGSSDTGL